MKNRFNFMMTSRITLSLIAGVLLLSSCNKEKDEAVQPDNSKDLKAVTTSSSNFTTNYVTLFAGQTIDAGQVQFTQDDVNQLLYVTYSLTNGWELVDIHFSIGSTFASIPVNRSGNPVPGQFAYQPQDEFGLTTYTLAIPYSSIGFVCPGPATYYIAAHASLRKPNGSGGYQTETGWGDGARIAQRGSWAEFFTIQITCDPTGPDDDYLTGSETGFAYNQLYSSCFLNHGFSRWGWTNGSLTPGTYVFDLYAGAGQCDLGNGINTGTVTLVYDTNGTITVTYQTSDNEYGDPYTLEEIHVYVGSGMFPLKNGETTVAPGQYSYIYDLDAAESFTFTKTGISGSIYFIAHAVVSNIPVE